MRRLLSLFLFLFLVYGILLLSPSKTLAHGLTKSLTSQQDPYQLIVTYDETDLALWGYTTFGFFLKDSNSNIVDLENVWFRITKDNEVIFAGPISGKGQPPIATISFAKEGTYKIYTRFQKDEKTQKDANFEITVPKIENNKTFLSKSLAVALPFISGVILSALFFFGFKLVRKKH